MTSVRKVAKTTITLVVLIVGLAMLMHWSATLSDGLFYKTNLLLNSKKTDRRIPRLCSFAQFLVPSYIIEC